MKIHRFPFLYIFFFFLLTLAFLDNFRRASEEKLDSFVGFKNSKLPYLVIQTDASKPIKSKENYRKCDVTFISDYSEIENYFEKNEKPQKFRAKIRGRGNSTWVSFDTNKRSYLLKFDEEISLYGLPGSRKWILQANLTDKTSLRNVYAYHLGQEIFTNVGWTPKTKFVNLSINNKNIGLYGVMEKAEISPNRINLPLDENDESFLAEVNSRLNRAWNFKSDKSVNFSIREKEGANQEYYLQAEEKLKNFEEILYGEDFKNPNFGYRAYIDFESFVDWYLVNEFTKNHDARFQDSCFLTYDSRDKKLHMGPVWDFDIACGNNKDECADPEGLYIQSRLWFARLWEDEYFRAKVFERWQECREKITESFVWLEDMANFLEEDANLDNKIWQRFGYRQWPNAPGYKERKTYRSEVDYMENWLKKRAEWLDKDFLSTNPTNTH